MTFEESRSVTASALAVIFVAAAVTAGSAQAPRPRWTTSSVTLHIVRTAGTCPKTMTVVTAERDYDGGVEFRTTARTEPFAIAPRLLVRHEHRVEFVATTLKPAYARCNGTARVGGAEGHMYTLTLRRGSMRLVFGYSPELHVIGAGAGRGNPTVNVAIAD